MNRIYLALHCAVVSLVGSALTLEVNAATTKATAAAFVSGSTVDQSDSAGPEGAQASAAQDLASPIGDVFVNALASSIPGSLRAAGSARTNGTPGGFQGRATATWSDAFVISSPDYSSPSSGKFSGSVQVTGELLAAFQGRVYSDSQVGANVDIFSSGLNGGRTVVGGGARNLVGYDIAGIRIQPDGFSLIFSEVPFNFDETITVSLDLNVTADLNVIDAGATGSSSANYGGTMVWSGISSVVDQDGKLLPVSSYTAVSPESGFNFAPVPEPSTVILFGVGLFVLLATRVRPTLRLRFAN